MIHLKRQTLGVAKVQPKKWVNFVNEVNLTSLMNTCLMMPETVFF